MKTYRTIEEYQFDAKNIFFNLEWRQIVARTSDDGCFIYKREWDRTLGTLDNLLDNIEWARGIIRSMLLSPIPSEIEESKNFISKIYYYKEFAFFDVRFSSFFSEWQKFYAVMEGEQKIMEKPIKMKILPDTKKVIAVNGVIPSERKMKIWETFKISGYIDGEADAFFQLCDGYTPKKALKWLKTITGGNAGSFSGMSLIHWLKRLGIDSGKKNRNIRAVVCFFQNNEGIPLTGVNAHSYLQSHKKAKSSNSIIKEIDLLFAKVDGTAPL